MGRRASPQGRRVHAPRDDAARSVRELIDDVVEVAGLRLEISRPPDAAELIDEREFAERDEFLPYWAELWPTAVELANAVARRDLAGARVVELGCGLAIPSIVAARRGARVVATDWAEAALRLARENASRNSASIETLHVDWREPDPLVARAPFDLVLASDVLYERRHVEPLLALLPRLGDEVLLAEPGRPYAEDFLARAARDWRITRDARVYVLAKRSP